jgi:hypothetical protein
LNEEDAMQGGTTGTAVKRRGILAAAGAVVAGIVAKHGVSPVEATSGTGAQGALILASNPTDNTANLATRPTYLLNTANGTPSISSFSFDTAFLAASISGAGLIGRSTSGVGVDGVSDQFHGIIGQTGTGSGHAGVAGFGAGTNTIGVLGDGAGGGGSSIGAVGIQGQNAQFGVVGKVSNVPNTIAVHGDNQSSGAGGIGVQGQIAGTAANTIGVYGVNYSTGTNTTGVYGAASVGNGVVGATYGTGGVAGVYGYSNSAYGVIGSTTATGYSGLTAITGTPGVAALAATSTNGGAYAAYFQGSTVVQGDFAVVGGAKSAAVKDAAGQHRLVYCMESPESWFEDFGRSKLVNGRADVALDPIFAQIVHADDYHVFLTEYDDHSALFVTKQTAAGFAVHAKGNPAASGTFSYRVVAKRADIKGERLARFEMPKIHIPDESKLITPAPPKKP